jgi:hypothetical protein
MFSIFITKRKFEIWDGSYIYDNHFLDEQKLPVPFRIEFTKNWWGRNIGKVKDDFTKGGMKEEGIIKGMIKKDAIRFTKYMPKFSGYDHLGRPLNLDIPHPLLHYKGTFNKAVNKYEGVWFIESIKFEGKDRKYYESGEATGTWEMRAST